MATFTVLSADRGPVKDTDYGQKAGIKMHLKDSGGLEFNAEWWTKADTPLPAVGSSIEGDVEDGPYGKKFKKARSGFGGGGGPRGRSPEDTRAIQRQHSQEMALRLFAASEPLVEGRTAKTYLPVIKELTDWFERDITSSQGSAPTHASSGSSSLPPASVNVPPNGSPKGGDQAALASSGRKGATSRRFKAAGIDPETQRRVVHAIAGDPPTEAGLTAIDAALIANDFHVLFDEQGIPRPDDLPDTRDLASVIPDDGTIL